MGAGWCLSKLGIAAWASGQKILNNILDFCNQTKAESCFNGYKVRPETEQSNESIYLHYPQSNSFPWTKCNKSKEKQELRM